MNPKDATTLIFRILGVDVTQKAKFREVQSLMELIFARGVAEKKQSNVKDTPNDIKPEDNTINLQEVDHFEFPKEFNIQVEGDESTLRKVKIFPDGLSEEPAASTPATT